MVLSRTGKARWGGREDSVKLYVRVTKPNGKRSWETVGTISRFSHVGPWYLSLIGDVFLKTVPNWARNRTGIEPTSMFERHVAAEDFDVE